MAHGTNIPLYNPWSMGYVHHLSGCATHGTWGGYTVVPYMTHRESLLLYNPSPLDHQSPIHHELYNNLTPMGHGLYNTFHIVWPMQYGYKKTEMLYSPSVMGIGSHCTIHDAWGDISLYNPLCMGKVSSINVVQPITLGQLISHPPWVVQWPYPPWVMGCTICCTTFVWP
jgi:hypothetical protein